nr:protein tyrosine kinase [Chloroflexota bacterium]
MELKQYGMILWRWLWLIILGTALAAGVAYFTSRRTTPIYEATATILVSEGQGVRTTDYSSLVASEQLAQTYAQLMTKRPVLEEAIKTLNLSITTNELAKLVSVTLVPNTQLLKINVENEDPVVAATLANFIPDVFSRQNEAQQASRYASSKTNLSKELDSINALIEQTQRGISAVGTPSAPDKLTELARMQSEMAQLRQSYASVLQSYESLRLA